MERGTYTSRRVDFSKLAAAFFDPHLFIDPRRTEFGCGASALALLTGIAPEVIAKKHGPGKHYSDRFMIGFLRANGFTVERLTLCRMSNGSQISLANVVLLSQLLLPNEGTWGVAYDQIYYHNFDVYKIDHLSLINKPPITAYAIAHERWRSYPILIDGPRKSPLEFGTK